MSTPQPRTLEPDEVAERPDEPEAVKERPPSMDQVCIERFNLPADWEISAWEKKGLIDHGRDYKYMTIKGGVYKQKFIRGPRKGQTNFRKPEPDTEVEVTLLSTEIDAWMEQWERNTGYCNKCRGTGYAWSGWNVVSGCRFRPCKPCNATGKFQE